MVSRGYNILRYPLKYIYIIYIQLNGKEFLFINNIQQMYFLNHVTNEQELRNIVQFALLLQMYFT